jgi:hypothetical protein
VPGASTSGCSPDHRGYGGGDFGAEWLTSQVTKSGRQLPLTVDAPASQSAASLGWSSGHLEAGPVVAGRVDQTRHMARCGQHELGVAAQLGAAVAARPGGDVVGDAGNQFGPEPGLAGRPTSAEWPATSPSVARPCPDSTSPRSTRRRRPAVHPGGGVVGGVVGSGRVMVGGGRHVCRVQVIPSRRPRACGSPA